MRKQVLFPTDFSACAERAFSHAVHLAEQYEARLHIVSVVEDEAEKQSSPMNYLPLGADELADELGISRDRSLEQPERGRTHLETINVTLTGLSPWRVILDYADENGIDLIVMGTHGRHGVDRVILGSVAEQVVRRANCPVFTVRESDQQIDLHGPIVVPIDFSPFSSGTIVQAIEIAQAYGSELRLVHVVEPIALPSVYGVDPSGVVVPDMESRSENALKELAAETVPDSVEVECRILVGHAVHEIVQFAEESRARMIVIATHGLTGLRRFLMGSVTEQIVREAPCPVFTVRSFGKQLSSAVASAVDVSDA